MNNTQQSMETRRMKHFSKKNLINIVYQGVYDIDETKTTQTHSKVNEILS